MPCFLHGLIPETGSKKSLEEKLADCFAAALLMPKDIVIKELKKKSRNDTVLHSDLISLAIEFRVSLQAFLWRLVGLRVLKKSVVESILGSEDLLQANRTARSSSNEDAEEFSRHFIKLAFKALTQGKISNRKFCSMLGIQRSNLKSFFVQKGLMEEFIHEKKIAVDYS